MLYSFLPSNSQSFPAIHIALLDQHSAVIEEANIALGVKVDKATAAKVNAVKSQTGDNTKGSSTKFTWSDLAKTGIAAILKYFTVAL